MMGLVWIFGCFRKFGVDRCMVGWWALSVGRVKYKPKYGWDLEIVL